MTPKPVVDALRGLSLGQFTDSPVCAKCGSMVVRSEWCSGRQKGAERLCQMNAPHGEHLTRLCASCGYQWLEATKDASSGKGVRDGAA